MKFNRCLKLFYVLLAFCFIVGAASADDDNRKGAYFQRQICLKPVFDGEEAPELLKFRLTSPSGAKLVTGEFFNQDNLDEPPSLIFGTWAIKDGQKVIAFTFTRVLDFDNVVNTGTIILNPWWINEEYDGVVFGVSTSGDRTSDAFGVGAFEVNVRRVPCPY